MDEFTITNEQYDEGMNKIAAEVEAASRCRCGHPKHDGAQCLDPEGCWCDE